MAVVFVGSRSSYSRQELRAKRFRRVTYDVYVENGDPVDPWVRAQAAGLIHPDAVVCCGTAAVLQRLPVDDDGLVHLSSGQLTARSRRREWRVRRLDVSADEIMTMNGIRMTTGPRTWTDLAPVLSNEELVAVGDVVLRRYGDAAVREAVERSWGRSGVTKLREVLGLLHAGADSPAESRARVRLHRAGFTALLPGHVIRDELGCWIAAPDLADPAAKVAVQHDGAVHFLGDARRRRNDVERDEQSRRLGWEVVVSTAPDDRDPTRLVERVASAYRRSASRHGAAVLPLHLRAA